MFRDSQSSFGLWAALANYGTVHAVPMLSFTQSHACATLTPNLGADWVWSNAPVLYPQEAFSLNFTTFDWGKPGPHQKDRDAFMKNMTDGEWGAILNWLESN